MLKQDGKEENGMFGKKYCKRLQACRGIAAGLKRKIKIQKRGKERLHFNLIYYYGSAEGHEYPDL